MYLHRVVIGVEDDRCRRCRIEIKSINECNLAGTFIFKLPYYIFVLLCCLFVSFYIVIFGSIQDYFKVSANDRAASVAFTSLKLTRTILDERYLRSDSQYDLGIINKMMVPIEVERFGSIIITMNVYPI